jgi:hypothetical protein
MRNIILLALAACTSSSTESTSSSQLTGAATYRDATTADNGQAQQPASPPPQHANVTIEVDGNGTIPQIDPHCATDPAGSFVATYASNAQLENGGAYIAAVAATSGTITTPSGCTIGNLTVGAVTGAKVIADLAINTENCQTYCDASARADAEAQCGATANAATCRAQMESSLSGSCQTTCTTHAHAIRAEADVGAAALGQLTADELKTAALGDLEASLVFSEMVDANGKKL